MFNLENLPHYVYSKEKCLERCLRWDNDNTMLDAKTVIGSLMYSFAFGAFCELVAIAYTYCFKEDSMDSRNAERVGRILNAVLVLSAACCVFYVMNSYPLAKTYELLHSNCENCFVPDLKQVISNFIRDNAPKTSIINYAGMMFASLSTPVVGNFCAKVVTKKFGELFMPSISPVVPTLAAIPTPAAPVAHTLARPAPVPAYIHSSCYSPCAGRKA